MILAPVRHTIAPPSGISTESWGMANRELSLQTSASSGPWSMDMIPSLRPVLQALDDESIEVVVLEKATQVAGSETILTWKNKQAAEDPGPAMWVFADKETSEEFCDDRIQPAIRACQPLAPLIIEAKFGQKRIVLRNGFSLVMAWASSIAKTASRPIRFLILDEITKPGYGKLGAEGSAINRCIQRTETFPNRKIVMLSSVTVEGDNMDRQMELCDEIREPAIRCPYCGNIQPLRFFADADGSTGYVKFPEEGTVRERAARARYKCRSCPAELTTAEKNAALTESLIVVRRACDGKPRRVGFHVSRLASLFPGGRLDSLVETFLLSKSDPAELQSFYNNSLALHWKVLRDLATFEEVLSAKVAGLPRLLVPADAVVLVASVDVQMDRFWYRLRAFSADRTSWGVDEGYVQTWQEVEKILFESEYKTANGDTMRVWRAGIDTGGGKAEGELISRSEETMQWAAKNRHRLPGLLWACKGASHSQTRPVKVGDLIDRNRRGEKIPGGRQITTIDTAFFKGIFWTRHSWAKEGKPGALYLHEETEDWYAKQILAERKKPLPGGGWEWVRVNPDNHMVDCEVLCLALADNSLAGGLRRFELTRPGGPKPPPKPPEPKREPRENPFTAGVGKIFGRG